MWWGSIEFVQLMRMRYTTGEERVSFAMTLLLIYCMKISETFRFLFPNTSLFIDNPGITITFGAIFK